MDADEQTLIFTAAGYVRRLPLATYHAQRPGGRGTRVIDTAEHDHVAALLAYLPADDLLLFTNRGRMYWLKASELPVSSSVWKGHPLLNALLSLQEGERVAAVIPKRELSERRYLALATAQGLVKKTESEAYDTPIRAEGIIAIKVRDGDELVQVRLTSGEDDILMVSRLGRSVRFSEESLRPMGRSASGLAGMNVSGTGDRVVALEIAEDDAELLVVTENGYGKRTAVSEYPVKGRGAKGVLTAHLTERKGALAAALIVREHQDLLFVTQNGMVQRTAVSGISQMARPTEGVKAMNVDDGDRVGTAVRASAG